MKQNNFLNQFLLSSPFIFFGKQNPNSKKEIVNFLNTFYFKNKELNGIEEVYKKLAESTKGIDDSSKKWFNFLSQIRCTNFLMENQYRIKGLEIAKGNSQLDFLLEDGRYGDVKSFSTNESKEDAYSLDEFVIKEFRDKKLMPAFNKQGANLVIIDDVFSYYGKQYGLLSYFLSFLHNSEIKDRYDLLHSILEPYLPKLLILSFVKSITINPTIKFVGKEFNPSC